MTKLSQRKTMWWYRGRAMVDGTLVCEAEISAMLVLDEPSPKST
jgi:3-hydroxyacyl-[acyl-carrier-protein] dehydratase